MSNQATNESWRQVLHGLGDYSFHDGDRLLVLYGDCAPERVAQLEAQFPDFDPATVQ